MFKPRISLIFFLSLKSSVLLSAPSLEFINEISIPSGTLFEKTEVGGLSGLFFDPASSSFVAVSDDRSMKAPARFYTFKVTQQGNKFNVAPSKVTVFRDASGKTFPERTTDFESITVLQNKQMIVVSEGDVRLRLDPEILLFSPDGKLLQKLDIPSEMKPTFRGVLQTSGAQNNIALESVSALPLPNSNTFITATENNLAQDPSDLVRLWRFKLPTSGTTPVIESENIYELDTQYTTFSGLVELVAETDKTFYSLERAYIPVANKNVIKVFYNEIPSDASDVKGTPTIEKSQKLKAIRKSQILDFEELLTKKLVKRLDNFEGMAFGPMIDKDQTLVVISDNNFSGTQQTLFFFFRIKK
ncbi:MAG: esterase-like activity of phytase family protein [Oligoflexales bacterium]